MVRQGAPAGPAAPAGAAWAAVAAFRAWAAVAAFRAWAAVAAFRAWAAWAAWAAVAAFRAWAAVAAFPAWAVWAAGAAWAGSVGTTAVDSLNLGIGPRAAAMGEAFTGVADDVYALYWNPAGLTRLYLPEASFSYVNLFEDTQQHHLAYAYPDLSRGRVFAGSLSYLRVTPFQGYDNSAAKTGKVDASDMVFTLGAGQRWGRIAMGASLKYLRSELAGVAAQTPSADAGLSFLSRNTVEEGRLDFGFSASNLFGDLKYDAKAFPLPRTFRFGVGFAKTLIADDALYLSADAVRSDAAEGFEYGVGAEYWLLNLVALGSNLRAGMGLRFRFVEFDYAWAGYGDLGAVHRAAVTVRFGAFRSPAALEVQRLFERADYLDGQGRYLEEVLILNRILDIDSANAKALEMMKKAATKVKKVQHDEK